MVHQYKLNGYNIVLDTCSGSVHTVDDVAYDIISLYKEKSADEICDIIIKKYPEENLSEQDIRDCLEDIKYLEDNKKLFIIPSRYIREYGF